MSKLTLSTITGGYGSVDTINTNFSAIVALIDTLVSRDGTSPNTMTATLDMNSQRLINLPDPVSSSEAATKGYADQTVADAEGFADDAEASATAAAASAVAAASSASASAVSASDSEQSATLASTYAQLSYISDYGDLTTGVNTFDYGAVA